MKYENLTDLTEILREIGEATRSFAVLLWELTPATNPQDESGSGQLFVLAHWLKSGDHFYSHALSLSSSTGTAIINDTVEICNNLGKDLHHDNPNFLEKYDVKSFVSIPIHLDGSTKGALNLYRLAHHPISDSEFELAKAFAPLLPGLYQGLHEKSSLRMISMLNEIVQQYEQHTKSLQLQTAQEALQKIALAISHGFRCLETSIYLLQTDIAPGKARLEATTFPGYSSREYSVNDPGLTGWILRHRLPVRLLDLKFFDEDRTIIEARYPGLTGIQPRQMIEGTSSQLEIEPELLPPLSFMGVPILLGDELLGLIRCCTRMQAPYYFNDRDLKLLTIAASQVGHYWKNWLHLNAIQDESRSWQSLVDSIGSLIRGVLSEPEPDENAKLMQFLRAAHEIIPGAEVIDVRLHDPQRDDLYFAQTFGDAWGEEDPEEKRRRRETRFPLNGASAGTWVFQKNQTRLLPDLSQDPLYARTFAGVKSMIIAPISSGNERYGVLDIRITTDTGITPNAPSIAELLGKQLGLYLHLSRTLQKISAAERELKQNITRLEQAEAEREKVFETQIRVFEDLEHELKLPILQAHSRLSQLLAKTFPADKVIYNVQAIRGLLRKAERVVRGMDMFVTLAQGHALKSRLTNLYKGPLLKSLIEICMDCIFLEGHKSRGLRSHVVERSFDVLDTTDVKCDFDLLQQAIYDIVDNACKYSFSDQEILVRGGVNGQGRFYIAVIDKGLPLFPDDITHATERGWRGQKALLATGQGSGIGCWFADQVMRAHGGHLELFATTSNKLTEVRLQF